MADYCELSVIVKAGEIIDLLSNYKHLKKELLCLVN
jgi:hypothetical protein